MAAPMGSKHEAGTKISKGAGLIDGLHTNVICMEYSNKLFIVVTQMEKLGTLVEASRDAPNFEDPGNPTFSTKVLLGKDEPVTHVIARSIASKVPIQKPILLAMALRNTSPRILRAVENLIIENGTW